MNPRKYHNIIWLIHYIKILMKSAISKSILKIYKEILIRETDIIKEPGNQIKDNPGVPASLSLAIKR